MKAAPYVVYFVIAIAALAVAMALGRTALCTHWIVEPAPNGQWIACEVGPSFRDCNPPESYDAALWWSKTDGGRNNFER